MAVRWATVAIGVVLLLGVGGCGGSSSNGESAASAQSTATSAGVTESTTSTHPPNGGTGNGNGSGSMITGTTTGSDTSSQPGRRATAAASGGCHRAPHRLAATLRDGVQGVRVGRVFAVPSNSSFNGKAPSVRGGVYFVAGDLGVGAPVGTWAANERALRSGRGLMLAVDGEARSVSPRGWTVARRRLADRFGIDPHTDGWARARDCANPTRAQVSEAAH